MAKSKDGFFGKLSGKIGDVVVASWKGITYIRSRPKPYTSNTPAQKKQRSKFGLIIKFVNRIRPVINAGFKRNTDQMTELNSATSYLMKRAITTVGGQPKIHFPSVLIARGDLAKPLNASAQLTENEIIFSWMYDEDQPGARADDRILVVAYDPVHKEAYYKAAEQGCRADELYKLSVVVPHENTTLETYLAFTSADGADACDSVYLGQLSLSGE